eukprot:53247-Amphidinium_carterae.2
MHLCVLSTTSPNRGTKAGELKRRRKTSGQGALGLDLWEGSDPAVPVLHSSKVHRRKPRCPAPEMAQG